MKNDCNSIEELNVLYNESEQAYNEASKDFMNIIGLFFIWHTHTTKVRGISCFSYRKNYEFFIRQTYKINYFHILNFFAFTVIVQNVWGLWDNE